MQMVCFHIMGLHTSNLMGEMNNRFQLSTYRPLLAFNSLRSINLLSDSIASFCKNNLEGLEINQKRNKENLEQSEMIVTLINKKVGYQKGEQIVQSAREKNISVKEEIVDSGIMSPTELENMIQASI